MSLESLTKQELKKRRTNKSGIAQNKKLIKLETITAISKQDANSKREAKSADSKSIDSKVVEAKILINLGAEVKDYIQELMLKSENAIARGYNAAKNFVAAKYNEFTEYMKSLFSRPLWEYFSYLSNHLKADKQEHGEYAKAPEELDDVKEDKLSMSTESINRIMQTTKYFKFLSGAQPLGLSFAVPPSGISSMEFEKYRMWKLFNPALAKVLYYRC